MNTIDMNRLFQFVRVVEAGNISRAAKGLDVPKSIVSRNLALLEREVGQQLVYRTTRRFHLTESGRVLYEGAKSGFLGIESALNGLSRAEEEISGSIRITAPDDIGVHLLTGLLVEFKNLYPKIVFDIIYTNQILDLVAEGIDIAVRAGGLKDSSLRQRKAGNIEMILVAAPSFLDRHSLITKIEDISSSPTIGFGASLKSRTWWLQSGKSKMAVKIKPVMTANNFLAVCDLVVRGYGVGYIPRFICEPHLQSGALIHVLKSWRNEGEPLHLVLPGQKELPRRLKIFSDFLVKRLLEIF